MLEVQGEPDRPDASRRANPGRGEFTHEQWTFRYQVLAAVALGMALAALAATRALRRWRCARPREVPAGPSEPAATRDAYHDRIAAELEALD